MCSTACQGKALGRLRGGLGTKFVGVCDAAGRLLDVVMVPGQAHELALSLMLLKRLPESPDWALADMACDAREFRLEAQAMGEAGQGSVRAAVGILAEGPIPACSRAREPRSRSPVRPTSTDTATSSSDAGRTSLGFRPR